MKKRSLFMILLSVLFLFSCTEKLSNENNQNQNPENQNGNGGENGGENGGGNGGNTETNLTPEQQKAFLLETGKELIGQMDLDYWKDAAASVVKFADFVSDTDADAITDKMVESGLMGKKQAVPQEGERYLQPINGYPYYSSYSRENEYVTEVRLSAIKGHFTLNGNTWVESGSASDFAMEGNADGENMRLALSFTDAQNLTLLAESTYVHSESAPARPGSLCIDYDKMQKDDLGEYSYPVNPVTGEELDVKFYMWGIDESGLLNRYREAHPGQEEDGAFWEGYDQYRADFYDQRQRIYDYRITYPAYERKEKNTRVSRIYMPKAIKGSLSGDKAVADIDIVVDYQGQGKALDPATDKLNITTSIKAGPYELKNVKINYLTDAAEVGIGFWNGSTQLVSLSVKEQGHAFSRIEKEDRNEESFEAWDADNNLFKVNYYYYSYYNEPVGKVDAIPTAAQVEADILGKVQLKGTADINAVMEQMGKLNDDQLTEAEFKKLVANLENAVSMEAFYNGGSKRQARLGFEPVVENNRRDVVPVIRFEDGSAYALAEDFFSESNFGELITLARQWEDKVREYFNNLLSQDK